MNMLNLCKKTQILNMLLLLIYVAGMAFIGLVTPDMMFFIFAALCLICLACAIIFFKKELRLNRFIKAAFYLNYLPFFLLILFLILQYLAISNDKIFDIAGDKTFLILGMLGLAISLFGIMLSVILFIVGFVKALRSKITDPA